MEGCYYNPLTSKCTRTTHCHKCDIYEKFYLNINSNDKDNCDWDDLSNILKKAINKQGLSKEQVIKIINEVLEGID